VDCLRAAGIDCCTLANNHVLDWGVAGLRETLQTLQAAGIAVTGAGADAVSARAPAAVALPSGRRLLVFGCCTGSSGVPAHWAAAADRPGVNYLADLRPGTAARIAETIRVARRDGDLVVVSVHWGANWDFAIGHDERAFARALVDEAGVDIVHGHSSHHVKGIEVHRGRLILYGCGDLINDYEGIGADPAYRGDLGLMYFPVLAQDGVLRELTMTPVRMRRFRLERAPAQDAGWLADTLNDAGERLGTQVARREDGRLALRRAGPNRLSP
jgi:poly-gamma-glutamate synthesis protein (capsule biosynthesis protein)